MTLAGLAVRCARRPWPVLLVWVGLVIAGVLGAPFLFGSLSSQAGYVDGSESVQAQRLLNRDEPAGAQLYALLEGRPVTAPGYRDSVALVVRRVAATPGVADVQTAWGDAAHLGEVPAPAGVSRDGEATVIGVTMRPTDQGWGHVDAVAATLRTLAAPRVVVGGGDLLDEEMQDQAARDLSRAETISTPLILILLLVVFGGLVAAGLPLLVTLVGVGATLLFLTVVSLVGDVSVYAVNVVTMLGLGIAVDYALLLVSRFREERAAGADSPVVVARTYATAGRTVAFSGLTVAASLAALLAFPDPFLRSMGTAGIGVVLLDMAAAVTLLPALLGLLGHRIRASTPTAGDGRVFALVARAVRRAPLVVLVGISALLVLAAVPFIGVRFADPDARSLPHSSPSRQLTEVVDARFALAEATDPVTVVARSRIPATQLSPYLASLRALPGARSVAARDDVPGLSVIDVVPTGTDQGDAARRLVRDVRSLRAPVPVQVTGDAAQLLDYQAAIVGRTPWALGILCLTTFVLLFAFTGSVVLPLKAILMNLLSLGASFGALVWVFQDGHLGGLVGTEALGSLSITTPVLVFAIAFGLSMDYEVFLLGRIAEIHRRTGDNDTAVEQGLRRTGGVITAAALLMAVVFAAFVAGGFSPIKQVGLGLMLAVLLDATLVRMLVVPAFMSVMGRANWWAPVPLRLLHRRVGLTEEAA